MWLCQHVQVISWKIILSLEIRNFLYLWRRTNWKLHPIFRVFGRHAKQGRERASSNRNPFKICEVITYIRRLLLTITLVSEDEYVLKHRDYLTEYSNKVMSEELWNSCAECSGIILGGDNVLVDLFYVTFLCPPYYFPPYF